MQLEARTESSPELFVGFTQDEWMAAFALGGMPRHQAFAVANDLFRDLARSPSNGYSIPPRTWALLARVNPSCAQRVRERLSAAPPKVLKEVERLLEELGP